MVDGVGVGGRTNSVGFLGLFFGKNWGFWVGNRVFLRGR